MYALLRLTLLVLTLYAAGCTTPEGRGLRHEGALAHATGREDLREAHASIRQSHRKLLPAPVRAGHLLDAAASATKVWNVSGDEREERTARRLYNRATSELTALLREHPRLWQRKVDIPSPRTGTVYRLKLTGPTATLWDPGYFTSYLPARKISRRGFRQNVTVRGYGAALVGVRDPRVLNLPREPFSDGGEVAAAVTATLDFATARESDPLRPVTLALHNPLKTSEVMLAGSRRTLAADFTAPLAYFPRVSEFWTGIKAMLNVERFLTTAGLLRYEPFDQERIPVIYVHGLASTPQMWLDVINEINADPELRERFQPWTFRYPSGLPVLYAAMGLREQLEAARQTFPMTRGYILVGHSMGGLISRLQVSDVQRQLWNAALGSRAERLYTRVPDDSMLKRATIFEADPYARRLVFICVPHRGSEIASGSLGHFATRLIHMPAALVSMMENTVGGSLEVLTGVRGNRFPTSIQSLSPKSPTLEALHTIVPAAPHHSIIGDRGRGDTPDSSDGVVPYWSSHIPSAETELIVPGPHGAYDLPQTIDELRRILRQQLTIGFSRK